MNKNRCSPTGVVTASVHFLQMLQNSGSWPKPHPEITRGAVQSTDAWLLSLEVLVTLAWDVASGWEFQTSPQAILMCSQGQEPLPIEGAVC